VYKFELVHLYAIFGFAGLWKFKIRKKPWFFKRKPTITHPYITKRIGPQIANSQSATSAEGL
jgi:hypothetical protein